MHARPHPPRTARALFYGLLAVFLLAQSLGWVHRALHGIPSTAHAVAGALAPAASASSHRAHAPHGAHAGHLWTDGLFAGHGGTSDCLLLDALSHADSLPLAPVFLALAPAAAFFVAAGPAWTGRQALAVRARGPPGSH